MANIFLDANDSFTQSSTNTNDSIFGRSSGTETVILQGNPTGTTLDGNVEVVQLAGTAAGTTLQVNATTGRLELVSGGTVFATFSGGLNQAVNLQFTDGNVTLTQTGANAFTIANPTNAANNVTINPTTPQAGGAVTLGPDRSTASPTDGGTTTPTGAQTFVLTTAVNNFTGSSGNDTFVADSTVTAASSIADSLDGGTGTDTFRLFVTDTNPITLPGIFTSIESVYINESGKYGHAEDLNLSSLTSVTAIEFDGGSTDSASASDERFVVTVGSGQTVTLDSIVDGDPGADTANEEGEFEIGSASSVTSVSVVFDDVGADTRATATNDLDIDIAGTGVTTLNVTSQGDTNYVGLINSGGSLATLTVTGDKMFDASKDAVSTLTTINASASTGGVKVNVDGSTLNVAATGGTGNDTFIIGGDLETADTINGGDGTDTVVVSQATFDSATSNFGRGVQALSNVEVLGTSATGTITIDASAFTAVNSFTNVSAVTGTGVAGTGGAVGRDGVNFAFAAGDGYIVGANITGGTTTGSAGSTGGDALEVAAKVNSGSDVVTITFAAGGTTTLTGGAGGSGSADGGAAINASTVETINIVTASALDDVVLTGGASGGSGGTGESAGATLSVGANATINLSGAGDVNLGLVATQGTSVDDVTVNGSAMTGVLTVVTGAGNDIISGGSKADVITAGTGTNMITGNGGADRFIFADGSSTSTAITSITDFQLGAGNDRIDFDGTIAYEALTTANAAAIAADTTLTDALTQAYGQLAADEATAFVFQGHAYVVFENGTNAGAYNAAEDVVVKLMGVTDLSSLDSGQIT